MDRELVTIQQAKALCNVSRRTIYNWMHHGKVDYTRTAGGSVRIYRDTLFMKPQEVVKTDEERKKDKRSFL